MQIFDVTRYESDPPGDIVLIEQLDALGNGQQPPKTLTVALADLPRLMWKLWRSLDAPQQKILLTAIAQMQKIESDSPSNEELSSLLAASKQ